MSNATTTQTAQPKPWMLAVDFVEAPELVEAKRSSDGEFLKRNCKLEVKPATFDAAQKMMADLYDSEPEMLFSARR